MRDRIDFRTVVEQADLQSVIEGVLYTASYQSGVPHWPCPWHDDHRPSLYLWADGRRYRCWVCGVQGDVLDFVSRYERVSLLEAARRLSGQPGPRAQASRRSVTSRVRPTPSPRATVATDHTEPAEIWLDPDWQRIVDEAVRYAEANLWGPDGKEALCWLRARGLHDHTIQSFRLGFLPKSEFSPRAVECLRDRDDEPRRLYIPRGITIPWLRPGSWYSPAADPDGGDPGPRWVGLNVRRLGWDVFGPLPSGQDGQPLSKYMCVAGSARGYLYPWPTLERTQGPLPALLVEGEFDALLGWQTFGDLVHVCSIGSGSSWNLQQASRAALARCPWLFLAFDHDQAGTQAALRWRSLAPQKSRRVLLPHGKDLTDFLTHQGNWEAWLASIAARCPNQKG